MATKRILSGIKPTGDVHLGGYLGAMKHWPGFQQPGQEVFFFLADLHALNSRQDPALLRSNSFDLVAWLLAVGINPDKSPIFAQSQVSAHAELGWIFNNYVTMGELSRMTQYKDKAAKQGAEGQLVALFDYPALMAADILLYDADEIPVGADQKQHVELTRDIAERFNNLYGDHFRLPAFVAPPAGARIMMLDEPTVKMSKSEGGAGCVYLLDNPEMVGRKFKRATTDSEGKIRYNRDKQPGVSNLLEIIAASTDTTIEAVSNEWAERSYADLKQGAAAVVNQLLAALQEKFRQLRADEEGLLAVLDAGRERAEAIATPKLGEVKKALGLL